MVRMMHQQLLLCLVTIDALQPQLYIAGIDATLPQDQQLVALVAALGGEGSVEAVDLFADRDFAFATMRSEATAAAALAHGARRPLFAAVERAKSSPRPRLRRTLESGLLAAAASASASCIEVVADGVKNPENAGGLLRLAATLGASSLVHVHADGSPPPAYLDAATPFGRRASAVARGCDAHVRPAAAARSELLAYMARNDRRPVVALETASDATPLPDVAFPERCAILVGGEGCGIRRRVASALQPEAGDAFAIIPMAGPHRSLNVATSLAIALYEYRRQWPA